MKPEHKKIFEALSDYQLMGLCIEREAGGEPMEGKIAVGTVVLERVDHRDWDGKTIREVVLKKWQFSWTMPEAGADYYAKAVEIASDFPGELKRRSALQVSYSLAIALIDKRIPRDPDLAAVNCCEYVAGKFRKHLDEHPEIKGNRWWQRMKLIKTIGGHEFYII